MKIYIATKLSYQREYKELRDLLIGDGHQITYDCSVHSSTKRESKERKQTIATDESFGVREAELLIVLLPGGRGTHVELGIAIGAGVPTLVVGEQFENGKECVFYEHPGAWRVDGLEWKKVVREAIREIHIKTALANRQ